MGSATVAREMPRPATDHRRATAERNLVAILDAAERLLERRSQASIAAVAAEAGVSRVTVYAHFPTREQLLEAVVERAVRHATVALEAAQPDDGPPLDALERVIAAGWRELDRNSAIAQAGAEQLSPAALARAHEAAYAQLRDFVQRGREEGAFRTDLPTDWLVTSCFALIHACGDEVRAGRLDQSRALEVLTVTLRDLMSGQRGAGRPTGSSSSPGASPPAGAPGR
jgi:TetR/AcrR family transcriptional repressor of mexCD-oprJ operon